VCPGPVNICCIKEGSPCSENVECCNSQEYGDAGAGGLSTNTTICMDGVCMRRLN
jgi:hypothetical protein